MLDCMIAPLLYQCCCLVIPSTGPCAPIHIQMLCAAPITALLHTTLPCCMIYTQTPVRYTIWTQLNMLTSWQR